jgi:uncharacterized Zn-finger protein
MSSTMTFSISIPSDDDGFVSRECPHCGDRFKITTTDLQSEDLLDLFCPYCGLPSSVNETHPSEVFEQAHIISENYVASMVNDAMKDLERSLSGSKHLKFKRGKPLPTEDEKILFEKEELAAIDLTCCAKVIKINDLSAVTGVYCPFCGVK